MSVLSSSRGTGSLRHLRRDDDLEAALDRRSGSTFEREARSFLATEAVELDAEDQTITSLRAIRKRVVEGAALVRCDGSEIELEAYLAGSLDSGWNVRSEVQRGDILIDTVGTGQDRRNRRSDACRG